MGMTSALSVMFLTLFSTLCLSLDRIGFAFPHWLYTNAELVPLLPALLIVGGFIVLTLSYVSWRKYKGEKAKQSDQKKRDKLVD